MTTARLLIILSISILFTSCSGSGRQKVLELNDGEKWTVNSEMMVHLRAAEKDLKVFHDSGSEDYAGLAERLQENINLLISSCTMKGKAHDELHKWLAPYIKQVKALSKSKDNAEASSILYEIEDGFDLFNQYFQ